MGLPITLPIADYPVRVTTQTELATFLLNALRNKQKVSLFFANTNFIVQCRNLLDRMRDRSVTIVNDGIGMDLAATLVHGRRFKENLNGTDFTPFLFRTSSVPLRVYMIGGRPEVLAKASEYVHQRLCQRVVGVCDGYEGLKNTPDLIAHINQARPDVVLVALGNPVQERWILDHRASLDAALVMGVGALFDFWAGEKPRAPKLVQRMRLEWLYRLALEPRRLMRRYTVDILVFFSHCFRYRSFAKAAVQRSNTI
ncbi:MAG TPA: WecB/TagA/CpsF family glycosyltransferase [Oxalicibacterium sp.]|jgi:beta-1,4-glucosyltransferase|nr:WecB/TagA/CpsF family glycosyltransferase [Oxalicibacterium sp.]